MEISTLRKGLLKQYFEKSGFASRSYLGGAVFEGVRFRNNGISELVQLVYGNDGGVSSQSLIIGIRLDALESERQKKKLENWTSPQRSQIELDDLPRWPSIYVQLDLTDSEAKQPHELDAIIERQFEHFQKYTDPLSIRNHVSETHGFEIATSRLVPSGQWEEWIASFDRHYEASGPGERPELD